LRLSHTPKLIAERTAQLPSGSRSDEHNDAFNEERASRRIRVSADDRSRLCSSAAEMLRQGAAHAGPIDEDTLVYRFDSTRRAPMSEARRGPM
jgi:hypothetical protein